MIERGATYLADEIRRYNYYINMLARFLNYPANRIS